MVPPQKDEAKGSLRIRFDPWTVFESFIWTGNNLRKSPRPPEDVLPNPEPCADYQSSLR